jgi:hypothetical protein
MCIHSLCLTSVRLHLENNSEEDLWLKQRNGEVSITVPHQTSVWEVPGLSPG